MDHDILRRDIVLQYCSWCLRQPVLFTVYCFGRQIIMILSVSSWSWWWPSSSLPPVGVVVLTIFVGWYILFEIGFFFHYHRNLIPFANQICPTRPPAPYRDYKDVGDRAKLLNRILDLLEEHYQLIKKTQDVSASEAYYNFIESWFCKKAVNDVNYERFSEQLYMTTLDVGLCPPLSLSSYSFGGASVNDDDGFTSSNDSLPQLVNTNVPKNNDIAIGKLRRDNMDEFLSWAFFGIDIGTVESDTAMKEALEHFYTILQSKAGLQFEPGRNTHFTPRWFTFEKVQSLYRPIGVYVAVALMQFAANCILYIMGFRQYTCEKGLRYWHRSATKHQQQQRKSPFLFFHGIAPGGHAPYLPIVLFGLLRGERSRKRDIFFFENKPISYALCFDALSEEDTVHGVLEAVHQHLDSYRANDLMLCGHSFGSCQLTWMINSPQLKSRVHSMILLDPVSILLHEPDIVVNFFYTRNPYHEDSYNRKSDNLAGKLVRFFHESKIHLVASSELFIEYYLRRNFAWYNSELWLDDIPLDVKVLVCLAKNDEIVNAKKIEREISRLSKSRSNIQKIVWDEVGHAHCICNPDRWSDIYVAMTKMEQ